MITLRDVSNSDEGIYSVWLNDSDLTAYLSRLCPKNSNVGNYDTSKVCWFIIEKSAVDIGSIWLERDDSDTDTVILGIFISCERQRDKGVGSEVIKKAIRASKQKIAFNKVRLNVRKENLRAIHCYEKCGFNISGKGQKRARGGAIIDYFVMEMKVED